MGHPMGGEFTVIQDRVLLFVWVVGWIWAWFGGKNTIHLGHWVRHGPLSDVDVAAIIGALGMLGFSFAPAYVFTAQPPRNSVCTFPDRIDQTRCLFDNLRLWTTPTGINAWHETSTALPAALVIAVGVLVALRGFLGRLLPAILIRMVSRAMLLLAALVLGWAIFNPSTDIF